MQQNFLPNNSYFGAPPVVHQPGNTNHNMTDQYQVPANINVNPYMSDIERNARNLGREMGLIESDMGFGLLV